MKYIHVLATGFLFFLITACTKHLGDVTDDTPTATLKFTSPTQGAIYKGNDSITILAQATSTETIHGYDISINKVNDTAMCYAIHVHDHNDTLNIFQKCKLDFGTPTDLEVTITLTLDHDGHTLSKKVGFRTE